MTVKTLLQNISYTDGAIYIRFNFDNVLFSTSKLLNLVGNKWSDSVIKQLPQLPTINEGRHREWLIDTVWKMNVVSHRLFKFSHLNR